MSRLIGVCGKKRSGKDTISDYLRENYGFTVYSFAGPMKEACKELFLMSEEQVNGSKKMELDERWGITPRRLLQLMGTELFQYDIHEHTSDDEFNIGREIWAERFRIWYNEEDRGNVVVSDVRFHHEVDKLREMGVEIWKVDRYDLDKDDQHSSEKELETIEADSYIQNFGTFTQLYDQIDALMK